MIMIPLHIGLGVCWLNVCVLSPIFQRIASLHFLPLLFHLKFSFQYVAISPPVLLDRFIHLSEQLNHFCLPAPSVSVPDPNCCRFCLAKRKEYAVVLHLHLSL